MSKIYWTEQKREFSGSKIAAIVNKNHDTADGKDPDFGDYRKRHYNVFTKRR